MEKQQSLAHTKINGKNSANLYAYSCENCGTPSGMVHVALSENDLSAEQRIVNPTGSRSFDYVQNRYTTPIVQCGDCHLAFRSHRPESGEILFAYQEESLDQSYDKKWKQSWRPIFTRLLHNIEERVNRKGKLLDIGAQLGFFAQIARESGWESLGIDPSNYTAKECGRQHMPLIQGISPDLPFQGSTFDVVSCWTVFENFAHWNKDVGQIRRVLKPHGLFALKVANFEFYQRLRNIPLPHELGKIRDTILKKTHLLGWPYQYGFNPSMMSNLLEERGFTDIEILNYELSYHDRSDKIDLFGRKAINGLSSVLYAASRGKMVIGPWMEIYARKSPVEVRNFLPSDQSIAKQLILDVLQEYGFPYNEELDRDLEDISVHYLKSGGTFFVLEDDNEVVGTIGVRRKNDNTAELRRFYIEKDYRGLGHGRRLFDQAIQYCKENGMKRIEFSTSPRFKRAIRIYKKRGFTVEYANQSEIFMARNLE